MNEQNSEQESQILPPPLPSEINSEHHSIIRKIRIQALCLCGQSVIAYPLYLYMNDQMRELRNQGHTDINTMINIVFETNQNLIHPVAFFYGATLTLVIQSLRELGALKNS